MTNKGDLISREALKNIFEEHEDRRGDLDCDWRILIDNALIVERPQGEWLEMKRKIDNIHSVFIFKCPFCGYIEKCKTNFCGKCGAEMRGKK